MKTDFNKPSTIDYDNYWYDLYEDWELIEASFLQQYNIRLRIIEDLSYEEFVIYLTKLSAETPLGNIISIRSENDRDVIKRFNPVQKKIRNDWRAYVNQLASQDEEYVKRKTEELTKAFERAFG